MMNFTVILLASLSILHGTHGYSSGAPESSCTSMKPSHGSSYYARYSSASTGRHPDFAVTVAGDGTYSPGQRLAVGLEKTGLKSFKGFLLQARKVDTGDAVGTFAVQHSRTQLACAEAALTHKPHLSVDRKLDVMWIAPQEPVGDIVFVATIVERYRTVHLNISSPVVRDSSALAQAHAELFTPASLNGTALIDPLLCGEDVLEPLPAARPHVAVLCTGAEGECPCSWRCCSRCHGSAAGEVTCEGHAICRQPRQPANATTITEDGEL